MNSLAIAALGEKILSGDTIARSEANALISAADDDIFLLTAYANKIRHHFAGNGVDMCGIISARSGKCSEDCKFCAQSCYHHTDITVHHLLDKNTIITAAKKAEAEGAARISLVTSGKGMEGDAPISPKFYKPSKPYCPILI
ncbi:MAG: hypothetical protein ABFC84_15940 [Veillonellales bacterium]